MRRRLPLRLGKGKPVRVEITDPDKLLSIAEFLGGYASMEILCGAMLRYPLGEACFIDGKWTELR